MLDHLSNQRGGFKMTGEIQNGMIMAIFKDPLTEREILLVKNNKKETVYIKEDETDTKNCLNLVGQTVSYIHTERIHDKQFASINKAASLAVEQLKSSFEKDPKAIYEAEVIQLKEDKVILEMNHYMVHLKRSDLTKDPITLSDLLSVGDKIEVKIKKMWARYIEVEVVHPLNAKGMFTRSQLNEEDLLYGVISAIKELEKTTDDSKEIAKHIFVTIGHELDLLAPDNCHLKLSDGVPVVVKINQLSSDSEGNLRGKVLRCLESDEKKSNHIIIDTPSPKVGDLLTGQVRLVREDFEFNEKILILLSQGLQIIVPFSELSAEDRAVFDIDWIGREITVKILSVNESIIGSKKQHDEEYRQQFISSWQADPDQIKLAYVTWIGSIGYILRVENEDVFLLKSDYMLTQASSKEPQLNDRLYVQLKTVKESVIHVKAISDYQSHELLTLGVTEKTLETKTSRTFSPKTGMITKLMKKGAYINVNDIHTYLPNISFSFGKTRVKDIYRLGDTLTVRYNATKEGHIMVAASPKFTGDELGMTFNELEEGMLVHGVIRTIKTSKNSSNRIEVFTSLGFNLDALSENPEYFEVEEGDRVIFKINQLRENQHVHGRIIRNLSSPRTRNDKIDNAVEIQCNQ